MRPVIAETAGEHQVGNWGGSQRGTAPHRSESNPGQLPAAEAAAGARCGVWVWPQDLDSE